ncbi:deoxyguanosinetriphosphate triphosphohydrolase [bacterium]|nr:deoxyguanosinetriphosphate triphosphohydrolase [candidate division CSSED10-310 bacterium]
MNDIRYRKELESLENQRLASFAMRSAASRGRRFPEEESISRTCYQRDIDRIVHSRAFRRLEYKTQVFVNYEGDHYRTRLTHTFEVSMVARALARSLALNEDLTEAIALAHDLGHTPFGHAGEEILNELMVDHGGFEHNRQSLRVVEYLEKRYPRFDGLNLTWEVREGLIKHASAFDHPDADGYEPEKRVSLEGQVVNLADEIAYNCHDLEDGLRSRVIDWKHLEAIPIWQIAFQEVGGQSLEPDIARHEAVRFIKDYFVKDAIRSSADAIKNLSPQTPDDARNHLTCLIGFSMHAQRMIHELSTFLLHNFYFHYRVIRMTTKAKWFLRDLFERYTTTQRLLPDKIQRYIQVSGDKERVICDYIAGMTDRFALDEYQKLTDPGSRI